MLCELYISNVAVIASQTIDFSPGLNVFTGETGAGKSIVIDSINAVTGARTPRDLIRAGEDTANISAVFRDIGAAALSAAEGAGFAPDEDGCLTLSRRLSRDGRSVCRINGETVTVPVLREVGMALINIHGQHDNQSLLRPELNHTFLDKMAGAQAILAQYRARYGEVVACDREIKKLTMDDAERARLSDLLNYQIGEIEAANVSPGEYDSLLEEREVIRNAEKISEALALCARALSGDEDDPEVPGAVQLSQEAADSLNAVADVSADFTRHSGALRDAACILSDEADYIRGCMDKADYSPEEAERVEARLSELHSLMRKYGSTEDNIITFCEDAKKRLGGLETSGDRLASLRAARPALVKALVAAGAALTQSRQDAGRVFAAEIEKDLRFLDMPDAVFGVSIETAPYGPDGCDNVVFSISANPGEPPRPLNKVASGGELSRIMLAIKDVLAGRDDIDTLIFDEIDSGVSGRAAGKIALKLRDVAAHRQVICVTHLAQIAAAAGEHLLIKKTVANGRTYTSISPLDRDGRIEELARITGGLNVTDAQRRAAASLLDEGQSDQ